MVAHDDGGDLCGIEQQPSTNVADNTSSSEFSTGLDISTSRKTLLNGAGTSSSTGEGKLRISKVVPSRLQILLSSPSAKFKQIVEGRDEMSRTVPSSTTQRFRERLQRTLSRKINLESMCAMFKTWIKSPLNMVLLLWITCVAASGALLFLVMTGMLNHAIPKKSQRDIWFEVNNQILNALFTLMCLYQHPKRFYHLVLLCRWKPPKDITTLRNAYCKNGTYKPNEWAHMLVVISLLHLNCFAQYALCGLNLGYRRSARPAIGVAICLSVAIAAPAIASVYCILSPLGKEYEDLGMDDDVESQSRRLSSSEKRFSFASRSELADCAENAPNWKGGLFDIWDDISVAYLSLFCTCCAFGWNMERLGFGNMYVHIATFMLFCSAPFWIFNLAAVNIDNDTARSAMGLIGVVLCLFGLLYGGFWRIQMRKRFNLPAADKDVCCGKPEVADCAQWLCCCWCSLAQEVRTADFYDVVENKFYRKQGNELPAMSPLGREGRNPSPAPSRPTRLNYSTGRPVFEIQPQFSAEDDDVMKPPVLSSIQREQTSGPK
ncbi:unnamed protein product [Linum tenue]|uniref:PLAC8 family protein n=1 Tax=Linum tenue TaxID=586396 RepID=A0AAV0KR80_9ROSI|nr:unnamed protein product [Linum tenue]